MTDDQIKAQHAMAQSSAIIGGGSPNAVYLRERVVSWLLQRHDNTAILLDQADRIVKYIQTGDTKA